MHILDLVENSTRAGARNVSIDIVEDAEKALLTITIADDGKGMTAEQVNRALDPFYTTKEVRQVGLGLPMMKANAEQCGGSLVIESEPGKGTTVRISMLLNHIDRPPMGDLNETIMVLVTGNPEVDFDVRYSTNGEVEHFTTRGGEPAEGTPDDATDQKAS